jgi:hypothetical protein
LPARQKHQNPHGRFLGEEAENFPSPPHPSLPDDARCASWAATTLAAAPPVKSVTLSAAHPAVDRREEERVNGSRHESVWSLRSVAVHTTEPALGRGFQCCLPATHEAPPVCAAWRGEARLTCAADIGNGTRENSRVPSCRTAGRWGPVV